MQAPDANADLPPISDRLEALGLTADRLGEDAPPDAWMSVLREWARTLSGDYTRRQAERDAVRGVLAEVGVLAPKRAVDAALEDARPDAPTLEGTGDVGTVGDRVVDIVRTGDGELRWLVADADGVDVVEETADGRRPWRAAVLPWAPIPEARAVKAALNAGARAPLEELAAFVDERVVLPDPSGPWAVKLAAWSLGTYLLDQFVYYPLLLFEGPPERGKTRTAKALLWPAFRGYHTPTPTSATLFRDRAHHRVTLALDVEDLARVLERTDIGDLVLAGFERDGVVRRCTRPDAEPEDQIETFAAYGASILTSNEPIPARSPLASRCIRVRLPEAGGVKVPPAATPEEAASLRARATAWAAATRALGDPLPDVDVPFTGRMADLSAPLIRVLEATAPSRVDRVVELLRDLDRERRAEAADSWEARVAVGLWDARDRVKHGRLYLDDLAEVVNDGRDMDDKLSNQQIGVARKKLGLTKGRGGSRGRTFIKWPGDDRVRALRDRYRVKGEGQDQGPEGVQRLQGGQTGLLDGGPDAEDPAEHPEGVQQHVQTQDPHDVGTSEGAEEAEHPLEGKADTPSPPDDDDLDEFDSATGLGP